MPATFHRVGSPLNAAISGCRCRAATSAGPLDVQPPRGAQPHVDQTRPVRLMTPTKSAVPGALHAVRGLAPSAFITVGVRSNRPCRIDSVEDLGVFDGLAAALSGLAMIKPTNER